MYLLTVTSVTKISYNNIIEMYNKITNLQMIITDGNSALISSCVTDGF